MKYKISVVKKSKKAKFSARRNGEFKGRVIKSVLWFDSSRFRFMTDSQMKNSVLKILNQVPESEVECKPDFDRKERVIVNMKGKYSVDEAIFDEELKMPGHLLAKENKEQGKGRGIFG